MLQRVTQALFLRPDVTSGMGTPTEYASRVAQAMDRLTPAPSRTQLAAAAGVSYQAVRQLLTGESKAFGAPAHMRAARFLRVEAFWLATGEGAMEAANPAFSRLALEVAQWIDQIDDPEMRMRVWSINLRMAQHHVWPVFPDAAPPRPTIPQRAPAPTPEREPHR